MRTIYFLLLLVITTHSTINAQLVAPINLNNRWIYEDDLGYRYKQTIVDTSVIIDSIKYCRVKIQHQTSMSGYHEYIRLNEDSFYVWRTRYGSSPFYDSPYYKRNAQLGESWNDPIDTSASTTVVAIFPSSVFGVGVNMKIVNYSGYLNEMDRWWTEEFGRHNSISFWGEVLEVLKGCVIDDVAYGDTVFYHPVSVNEVKTFSTFTLFQNYPNPFNPATTIAYSIKNDGLVLLKVFDILGKEVAILVNENKPAGSYVVEFNASKLPSGIYLYKLISGNFTETKKLILMK